MNTGLVSVISPCYNVGKYLPKFLDSLLRQSYKNLEIILVDDGSTDETSKIINEHIPRLEAEGYAVKVVRQPNGGAASAIDCGLKLFSGEFLTWPDSDDWLTPDSIQERVRMFRENPEIGLVRCNAEKIEAETGKSLGFFDACSDKAYRNETLFLELVHIRTYFAPVCYMVRSSSFLEANPNRSIYVCHGATQNLQMLLPITHLCQSIQMEKPLAFYLVRGGSLSRSAKTPARAFEWDSLMWKITRQTLLRMRNIDETFLKNISHYFVRNKLLPASFRAQLKRESMGLLGESGLGFSRNAMGKALVQLRCSKFSGFLDAISLRYWSRVLSRLFWEVVRL